MVGRRAFVLGLGSLATGSALAQVDVGSASPMARLVPAQTLERAADEQYAELLAQARRQGALARTQDAQLLQLHAVARRLIPFALQWNERARAWRWEVNLIRSREINAFCMPGGKIAFYTGILDRLRLSEDEIAMVMGHEMAHALREHARERLAKTQATNIGINLGAQLLGLGDLGRMAAHLGGQLLTLKFSRSDESEADLVGLELAARAGYDPQAAVSLWRKMAEASGAGGVGFLSTHPSGPERIASLQKNLSKVQPLYEQARARRVQQ
ncbi:M48 family metallopeptidase [Comamonas sp. NLF-1-9]|uniref:M48 family metallopeptidase n=1 Tax=Comamonas sp. NLF-1-9 TaxID=2853163 RepID=UPI00210480F3|nr:M48 family metallopeptidase [Comamonas sp. NLF-1-9]